MDFWPLRTSWDHQPRATTLISRRATSETLVGMLCPPFFLSYGKIELHTKNEKQRMPRNLSRVWQGAGDEYGKGSLLPHFVCDNTFVFDYLKIFRVMLIAASVYRTANKINGLQTWFLVRIYMGNIRHLQPIQ